MLLVALSGWATEGERGGVLRVVEQPLAFGEARRELTLEYIRTRYDPAANSIEIVPRMIIVHWTGSASARSALATFRPDRLAGRPELVGAGKLNVSAHYLVDRDGTVYRLMPDRWMARHAIGLNRSAIGIENVGGPALPLTAAQLEANARLVRELKERHPDLRYLIGHHEYGSFRKTPLWEERDPSYYTRKQDPGPEFMGRLRALVSDLGLAATWDPSGGPASASVPGG
jgi:N-acetyl-anhydromuramyl-L-alanine amidase AmpD